MKLSIRHLILTAIVLLISIILSISGLLSNKKNSGEIPNIKGIETSLNRKYNQLKERNNHIYENIIINEEKSESFFYDECSSIFEEEGVGYFYYHNNELKYWTTNNIPLPTSTTISFFERSVINLNNGWYIAHSISWEDSHLVALFQFKKEYSYENNILKNSFHPDYEIDAKSTISLDSIKGSYKITLDTETTEEKIYLNIPEPDPDTELIFTSKHFIKLLNVFLGVLFIFLIFSYLSRKYPNFISIFTLLFFGILLYLRYYMLKHAIFADLVESPLFSPILFAESFWMPSLGEYLINVFFFIAFAIYVFIYFKPKVKIQPHIFPKTIFSISIAIIILLISKLITELFYGLVWNSSISFGFENILNLDIYSFLGTGIIVLIITGFLMIIYRVVKNFKPVISFYITCGALIVFFTYSVFSTVSEKYTLTTSLILNSSFLLIWIVLLFISLKKELNYFLSVLLLMLLALITSEHFSRFTNQKEIDTYKVITYNLAAERDVGAEFFLKQTYNEIKNSEALNNAVLNQDFLQIQTIVNKILLSKRYFNKYETQATICLSTDSLLIEPDFVNVECFDFFHNQIDNYGIIIPGSNFYFLDNHNGRISYLGEVSSRLIDSTFVNIYVELNSKIFSEGLGYPELLLDKKLTVKKISRKYNYAKYNNGHLISSKGDYKYRFTLKHEESDTSEYSHYVKDGYIHFRYRPDNENLIILSKPDTQYSSELVSFTYILSFLFILFNLLWLVINIRKGYLSKGINLKTKIQISFITILLLSLIFTGTISIYFIVRGYQDKQKETIQDKVHSVLVELEQNAGAEEEFNYKDSDYLNSLLVKYSNVFYTDINIYSLDGILLSSSRNELYDKGLKGRYIDSKAYKELIINKTGTLIINENIDNNEYLSAYVPFRNYDNEVIAYLNLPYFARQNEFKEEISNFVIAFSNIFLALILLSIVVGIFISRQLTRPLVVIQDKIKSMDIKRKAEKIVYTKNDELGGLIREYNRKVDELSESANKLAQSEREMAWREMAKQIAHEIKNPLTPMKLSVQYLERAYDKKDENWEKTYRKVSKNLIEQIDVLSGIASEFSNFAKMPASKKEIVNLIDIVNNTVGLYENTEYVDFITDINIKSRGLINADKEQMVRIFTNLIKNGIQAVPDNRQGKIQVRVDEYNESFIIRIIDNGCGIPEAMQTKIFQPNFTTKSSGMGLGLSMVKSMLISNNATIHFKTKEDEGTEFVIEIPVYAEQ